MAFDFPSSPTDGQTFTPSGGPTYVYKTANGAWRLQTSGGLGLLSISDNPPSSPAPGQMWLESDTGNLFAYWQDADSSQWVQINVPNVSGIAASTQRNLIVNSAVMINQETGYGTGVTAAGGYPADQWMFNYSGPTGGTHIGSVSNSPTSSGSVGTVGVYSGGTVYTSVAATNWSYLLQYIEGQQIAHLGWGTSVAIPAVLSFEAYCDTAGMYGAFVQSGNADRSIVFQLPLTVNWTRFVFAIPATTSGTFPRDNTRALAVGITPMVGTTFQTTAGAWASGNYLGPTGMGNLLAGTSRSLYIRKIGLYADPTGSGIPPIWTMPEYGADLLACQRYWATYRQFFQTPAAGAMIVAYPFKQTMRTTPTATIFGRSDSNVSGLTANSLSPTEANFQISTSAAGGYSSFGFTVNARM